MTPKFHSLKVTDVRKETEDTVSIAFDVPAELQADYQFIPGQYLTLKQMIKGEDVRRSYSICAAPYENELRVAVKAVEGGLFSNYANSELNKGDVLEVMTPAGNFKAETNPAKQKSYVLYAAGSGITPMMSIAKQVLEAEPLSDVTLFYGNKGFASIIFREELEGLKNTFTDRFRLVHLLSRENMGVPLNFGRIDNEKCGDLFKTFTDVEKADAFYICGPEEMIHTVRESLENKGVEKEKIHFELFTSPLGKLDAKKPKKVVDAKDEDKSDVIVILDEVEYNFKVHPDEESILDIAQQQGADLPFACKGGVCCTCKAKVLEGEVEMDVNFALEQDQVDAGYILTCQAHPRTKNVKVSFDV